MYRRFKEKNKKPFTLLLYSQYLQFCYLKEITIKDLKCAQIYTCTYVWGAFRKPIYLGPHLYPLKHTPGRVETSIFTKLPRYLCIQFTLSFMNNAK